MKLISIIKKYRRTISYLIFGILTTLINLATFNCLYTWKHLIGYQLATFISWLLSVIFAFFTNKFFVFETGVKNAQESLLELYSFFFWRAISLLIDFAVLKIGIGILKGNPFWVKLIDNIVVVCANYFFSLFFVFK